MDNLNFTLCSVPMLYSRNASKDYQERIVKKISVLMTFLKDNDLIFVEPFKSDGNLDLDFILKTNDSKPECVELFKKVIPGWFAFLDRGGQVDNTQRLLDGLRRLKG